MLSLGDQQPDIDYPTDWRYKLVGREEVAIRQTVQRVVGDRDHQLALSNRSRKGNYLSLELKLRVTSEEDRLGLFQSLGDDDAIIYVL